MWLVFLVNLISNQTTLFYWSQARSCSVTGRAHIFVRSGFEEVSLSPVRLHMSEWLGSPPRPLPMAAKRGGCGPVNLFFRSDNILLWLSGRLILLTVRAQIFVRSGFEDVSLPPGLHERVGVVG